MTTYGSVCSGIEAASVAWEPLGWTPAWFSEFDAFPSAVLQHHWPHVPNHGDMTLLADKVRRREVSAPDVLVGGTPCQSFSVAGLRGSMTDARGQLTLAYCDLLNAIDEVRCDDGQREATCVWENVPGVLSTKDNAFGCLLAALAGDDEPCLPGPAPDRPRATRWYNYDKSTGTHYPKWPLSGWVYGPRRSVAWRVLDAQYFGVAQRRRRVFVVASAADGFDPAAVLFESEGVRRDTPPSREAGQSTTYDVAPGLTASGRGVERRGESRGQDPVVAVPILEPGARTGKSTTDKRAGSGIGAQGDPMYTLQAGKQHGVGCWWDGGQISQTLDAVLHKGQTMPEKNRFPAVLQATSVTGDVTHTLNTASNGKGCSEDGTGRGVPTIAFHHNAQAAQLPTDTRDTSISDSLTTSQQAAVASEMAVRRLTPVECERLQGFPDNHTNVPYRGKPASDGPRYKAIGNSMAVPVMHWIGQRIHKIR